MATTPQVPEERESYLVYCYGCSKDYGAVPLKWHGIRLTCDKDHEHAAGVIKKPKRQDAKKHWPARDWLGIETRIRRYVDWIPRKLRFSGETAGRWNCYKILVLLVFFVLALFYGQLPCMWLVFGSIGFAFVWDTLMIATFATFVSRLPAHPLRTVVLTFISFIQIGFAYAIIYATAPAAFTERYGIWPLYFSLVTLATVGYGDVRLQAVVTDRPTVHPAVFVVLQVIVLSEIIVAVYLITTLIAVVATWMNEPPRPRLLISEFLTKVREEQAGHN